MIHSDANPAAVPPQIIDAVGGHLPQLLAREIVDANLFRFSFRPPFLPVILEFAHQFFLLRVHRYHRLTLQQMLPHPLIDVFKLGVAVGMLPAFQRLAVRLQAVADGPQQLCHRLTVRLVTATIQLCG